MVLLGMCAYTCFHEKKRKFEYFFFWFSRHVVVGDAFGFEITHEKFIILLFFGGTTGICAWKCM